MTRMAVLFLILLSTSAYAETGNRFSAVVLSKFCNSSHGSAYDDGICAGYITGIGDMMMAEPGMDQKLCMPRDLSTSDFSKLVTRHLARHPDDVNKPASEIVRNALLKAFACE